MMVLGLGPLLEVQVYGKQEQRKKGTVRHGLGLDNDRHDLNQARFDIVANP